LGLHRRALAPRGAIRMIRSIRTIRVGALVLDAGSGRTAGEPSSSAHLRAANPSGPRNAHVFASKSGGVAVVALAPVRRERPGRRDAMVRRKRLQCRNLRGVSGVDVMVSSSRPFVCVRLSTCFQPSWCPTASFVLHTMQGVAPQAFHRGLARNHERP
jgi:hypothetical protein